MRDARGFTLIELMIVVAVIAILAAVGYPSYRDHIARGQRSAGQQFLLDLAQRQEQHLLDRRLYADQLGTAANGLGINTLPTAIAGKYQNPVLTTTAPSAGVPPAFVICMDPVAGSPAAAKGDGTLCLNNLSQRWRQPLGGDTTFGGGECAWDNRSCRISGES